MNSRYDTTGTGNSLLMRHPHVLQLIMDSLRYWVTEMHVDGFRFDLASVLGRGSDGSFRSSAAFRARIALNLKGIKPELRFVHLLKDGGQQHTDAYRTLNPQELIPALAHDGHLITQSLAIIEYLDEIVPQPPLLPKDAFGRARARLEWRRRALPALAQSIALTTKYPGKVHLLPATLETTQWGWFDNAQPPVLKGMKDLTVLCENRNADANAFKIALDQITRAVLKFGENLGEFGFAFDDEHFAPTVALAPAASRNAREVLAHCHRRSTVRPIRR